MQVSSVETPLVGELLPGERIRWSGRPNPRRLFTRDDLFLVPFSVLWCAFAIVWTIIAINDGAPLLFAIVGVFFVFLGVNFVFGRFVGRFRARVRTFYALTDRRVVVARRDRGGLTVRSAYLEQLAALDKRVRPDGSGTIAFEAEPTNGERRFGVPFPFPASQPLWLAFEEIPDVPAVWRLLSDASARVRPARR